MPISNNSDNQTKHHSGKESQEKFFLGRQPILDRQQNMVGYEFLFRSADSPSADITNYLHAGCSVIINALSAFGFREVLGKHKGFFNVTADLLMSDALELLPREQIVIELMETIVFNDAVVARCRELKRKGFSLALDDHIYDPVYEPLYQIVDFVKVDIQQISQSSLAEIVRLLKKQPVILLAEKVEDVKQFRHCLELGFQLFQGYYFARPSVLKKRRMDISGITLVKLLEQVLTNADIGEIEETFKQAPGLTYNLLRLVNSVVMGMRENIKTLRHALTVLGMSQLKRWVQLALFSSNPQGAGIPLLETAAVRGRLMEILVQKRPELSGDTDCPDRAFMAGVLSLMDVLFETPMEYLVQQLSLAEDVRLALVSREGVLGRMLTLIENLEQMEFKAASRSLAESQCSMDSLLEAQLEAINWTNSLV
jgi:c-di-GMP-related signal transduction protein